MATGTIIVDVIDSLYTHLTGDSTFNTALGGSASVKGRLRFSQPERDLTFPYCFYDIIDDTSELDTFADDSYRMRVQFTVYDQATTTTGARSVAVIIDKLRARLHRASFSVTGHDQMGAQLDIERGPVREEQTWRMDADYFISGWKT